jgi:hypothetical protein
MEWVKKFSKHKKIYILPTANGLKLLSINLILLITGMIYGNNFILLFNFLVFSLFFCSMLYTHFNLEGIDLLSSEIDPGFANSVSNLNLSFKNNSNYSKFSINIKCSQTPLIQFKKSNDLFLEAKSTTKLSLPIELLKRGKSSINKIEVSTSYPFGFFRTFTYFHVNTNATIYPIPIKGDVVLVNNHLKLEGREDNDIELKEYLLGDSLTRIHWKKSAHNLISKKIIEYDYNAINITLKHKLKLNELELSNIAYSAIEFNRMKKIFGIEVENLHVPTGVGSGHLTITLEKLADYEC